MITNKTVIDLQKSVDISFDEASIVLPSKPKTKGLKESNPLYSISKHADFFIWFMKKVKEKSGDEDVLSSGWIRKSALFLHPDKYDQIVKNVFNNEDLRSMCSDAMTSIINFRDDVIARNKLYKLAKVRAEIERFEGYLARVFPRKISLWLMECDKIHRQALETKL